MSDLFSIVVIGNGFDRYHGLATTFADFRCFANTNNTAEYEILSQLLANSAGYSPSDQKNIASFWADFETSLGAISSTAFEKSILAYNTNGLPDDIFYSLQANQIVRRLEGLVGAEPMGSVNAFRDWVKSINIEEGTQGKFNFPKNAFYISFNYTDTLQKLYSIKHTYVKHIHGCVKDCDFKPIVGHGEILPSFVHDINCPPEYNPSNPWSQFMNNTKKDVARCSNLLRLNFDEMFEAGLPERIQITVLGHSVNQIDQPYFCLLNKYFPNADWRFSYHCDRDKQNVQKLNSVCNDMNLLCLKKLHEFEDDFSITGVDY
jgi:hypothetical protein